MVSKAALAAHKAAQEKNSTSVSSSNTAATVPDDSLPEEQLLVLSEKAKESVEKKFGESKNFQFARTRLDLFPKFDYEELQLGKVLGKGQFGVVSEVMGLSLQHSSAATPEQATGEETEDQDRDFIRQHCIRNGVARYAIKILNKEHFCSEDSFYTGVHDIAMEAHFLAAIEHPNILKLRGLSTDPFGAKQYFLLFDRLYGTLKDKISEWGLMKHKLNRGFKGLSKSTKIKKNDLLKDRLHAAVDLSSAIMYLHQNNIIDRDLKPENVGFDIRGDVKLFDFGLSCEFDPQQEGPYNLTGMTGSLLYMAPENYFEKPYDETIDIFALGIILWEMISLDRLYPNFNAKMLKDMVMTRGVRPAVNTKWSPGLSNLMKDMWGPAEDRPSARQVNILLRRELSNLQSESEGADNKQMMRRRSTFVQRRFVSKRNLAN